MSKSKLERQLELQLKGIKAQPWVCEYRPAREVVGNKPGVRERLKAAGLNDWRIDFAWPEHKFGIEINGGIWVKSGHSSGKGLQRDYTKAQQMAMLGWTVVPVSSTDVQTGRAAGFVERYFKMHINGSAL